MGRFDAILTNFSSGEFSKLVMGRVDIARYANGVDTLENFLNMLQGGIVSRPGGRYVASTKGNGIARLEPFQYSADLDYVMEMGDEYFRLYSNGADLISQTVFDTKLLIHADGVDTYGILGGSVIDSGNTGYVVTKANTAEISPIKFKFGNASIFFDGDGDGVSIPHNADQTFFADFGGGSTPYTIDFQFYPTQTGAIFWKSDGSANGEGYQCDYNYTTETIRMTAVEGNSTMLSIPAACTKDTWHHVAIVKEASGLWTIYVDGVAGTSASPTKTTVALTSRFYIGTHHPWPSYDVGDFGGYIDEFRISGVARWSTGFTAPTAEHTSDANTTLLLHANTLDESSTTVPKIVTFVGTAQLDTAAKKWGTASLLFDGNSDYLQIPDNVDFDVVGNPDSNRTIELQVKHADHVGTETYITQWEDANNYWLLQHVHGSGLRFIVVSSGVTIITTGFAGEITDTTTFHHIAVCKKGNKYGLYKDGIQIAYAQDSSTDTFAGDVYIGATGAPGDYYQGNIDEVRTINSNVTASSAEASSLSKML